MKQTSDITRRLANAQDTPANDPVLFTLWTEDKNFGAIQDLLKRYFPDGATITEGHGIYLGGTENALEIKIVSVRSQIQHATDLADAIKTMNRQSTVLLTWQAVGRLDV